MLFKFSTDDLPPDARLETFRDTLVRRMFNLELEPAQRHVPYSGSVELHLGNPVIYGRVAGDDATFSRDARRAQRNEGGVWALLTRSGRMHVAQNGAEHVLLPGDGVIFDATHPHSGRCIGASDTWIVQVPESVLALRDGARTATLLPQRGEASKLMMTVLEAQHRLGSAVSEAAQAATGRYLTDLLAQALVPASGLARAQTLGGAKAARLQAILDDIQTWCLDPELRATTTAMRLALTPRYVHLLLEETGRSFSEHLCQHRLRHASRLLADAAPGARNISDIAFNCGFSDISYFNRMFRRRFGCSPTEWRSKSRGNT